MLHAKSEQYSVYVANIKEHLGNKTSQDLLEELDREFEETCSRGEMIDSDLYYAYMDVIDEIDPIGEDPTDPATLFQQVQQNHPELFSECEPQAKPTAHPKFRMKRALLAAAIIAALILILTMAAYGGKVMTGFNSLGGDLFQIGCGTSGQLYLDQPAENGYRSLEEALTDRDLSGIAPTWIPEDYSLVGLEVADVNAYVNIVAGYSNGTNRIVIRILDYSDRKITESSFERSEEYDEIYRVNGIDHFLMLNYERAIAAWENGNCLCYITGSISEAQLKNMIDSIYERNGEP